MKRLTLLLLAAVAWARGGLSPEDWWQLREASDARIRGDGAWIVYVESWNDGASDEEYSNLWLATADGTERRQWTRGNRRDRSPRWSPDGSRIAWLSTRGGRTAIHVREWDRADDAVLETGAEEPLALAWSADAEAIAYLARVKTDAPAAAWAPADLLPFLRRDGTATEIFRISVTGGGKTRTIAAGNLNCGGEPA